jgi:hypothetical protein
MPDADLFLGIFCLPEDESVMFFRNVDWLSTDYMVLYPRRENSSLTNVIHQSFRRYRVQPYEEALNNPLIIKTNNHEIVGYIIFCILLFLSPR